MSFDTLGLSAELLRAVAEEGYTDPTPVQAQAIPQVLKRGDVLAGAQTGTGKTAGFTLPMLHLLNENPLNAGAKRHIRALILVPTRELAAQVHESIMTYGRYLPHIKSTVVFGGVGITPQIERLRRGVDILIATPGRLLDHVQQRTVDLSRVEIFVLDEADRMLDMGFIHDVRKTIALLPKQRQNLLFSATFSEEIRGLAGQILHNPAEIAVARRNATAESISQKVYFVDKDRKRELLSWLIGNENWKQVLVFTRTKHGADRLAEQLERDGIDTAALHGNKSQGARTRALDAFKKGKVAVLVATDIAARGIDIDELPHVVNYELPNVPEDYVHRIGRTGRAGAEGEAVSLVCHEEVRFLSAIESLIKKEIPRVSEPGFHPGFNPDSRPPAKKPPQQGRARNNAGESPRSHHSRTGSGSRSNDQAARPQQRQDQNRKRAAPRGRG